jgi:hypothetical protein
MARPLCKTPLETLIALPAGNPFSLPPAFPILTAIQNP